MSRVVAVLWFLSCVLASGAGAPAQDDIRYFHPEKFERPTKADDKGLLQWAEWKGEKCRTCSGTGKAKCTTCARFADEQPTCPECKRNEAREVVCRACAGSGEMPDPLEKVLCPGCLAAGFLLCTVCSGGGRLKVDKAKNWSDCPGCRGEGAFKCTVCNGVRVVDAAALKPSLKEANAAALTRAIAAIDQALKELAAFTPSGGEKSRKEVKALAKTLETASPAHPALKRAAKVLEDCMSKIYGGAQFQGHEENEAEFMALVKFNSEYYLKHQKRMMELAHKRAEANAKLLAEQKGK